MNEKDLFNQYVGKMESIDDDYFHNLNRDLLKGHNSYLRMRMKGSSFFNDEWISKIEDCIYELGQIVNNPLEVTTTEGNLTPIELAKKINYESIQHLASHSQYIKDIDEEGNVIPAKILSQFHKEELHTYENRFIATFIRRLVLFVEKRYEFIRTTVNFDTKDVLYIKNKSIVDGQEVSIETKVTVKKENEDTESKIGKEYVERVEKMRRYVNYFYNSAFMKELKTEKDVRKPILQTNIIRKNPLYHKCYETFLFIERFNSLGVEYALDQHYQSFSEKERKALNYILASHLLSLGSTERSRTYKKAKKTYKPRLLSSIDDEMFIYGEQLKGPIEFVRVDEKYNEYLKQKAEMKYVPKKPNKVEKEYFKEEIDLKKNTEKHIKEIELLLRRIRREIAKWEKIVEQLIKDRELEEAKEAEARLEELRKQEQDILERRRAAIIAAALGDKEQNIPEKTSKKQKKNAQQVIDEEQKVDSSNSEQTKEGSDVESDKSLKISIRPNEEETAEARDEEPVVEEAAIIEESSSEEPEIVTESQSEPTSEVVEEHDAEDEQSFVEEEKISEVVSNEEIIEEKPADEEVKEENASEILDETKAEQESSNEEILSENENSDQVETSFEDTKALEEMSEEKTSEDKVVKNEVLDEEIVESQEEQVSQEATLSEVHEQSEVNEKEIKEKSSKKRAKEEKSPENLGFFARRAARKEAKKQNKIDDKTESKSKPTKTEKPKSEPKSEPKPRDILEAIPGRFIVKTLKGYYISDKEFSNVKSKAVIFKDFNKARRIKEIFGGKVIKL